MNLKDKVLILFILIGNFCFGQTDSTETYPKTIVIESDTFQVYTIEQSKQMIVWNEMRKEHQRLNEICEATLKDKNIVIVETEEKVRELERIVANKDGIIKEKDDLYRILEIEKKEAQKEIKRQKRHKWFAIIIGGVATTLAILL